MLDTIHNTLAGRVTVEGDVHDIIRRIEQGDPVMGWPGDPDLRLVANVETREFEVWARDAHGDPYIAVTWPRCDASLIAELVRADNRLSNPLERVAVRETARVAAEEAAEEDRLTELADRLQFGLMKDIGHRHGGLTRRIH